jgi:hypothetical protein
MGGGGSPSYPPTDESEARRFFPQKDFVVKVEQKSADDVKTLTVEAAFHDVNALLASSYGRAHQLSLQTNANGTLKLQALSGGSTLAQMALFKPEGPAADVDVPGMDDAQKKKNEMRFEFRVVLPNAATDANGARDNKTVSWAVERAKCKDDDDFSAKLSGVLEATCSAEGIKFSPMTPARLGLVPFDQLTAGVTASATSLPDTNKIIAAARFIPYTLHVTRELDLSGDGSGQSSQAQLTGAILLPTELAPQRWGDAKLLEAVDGKGNSLMPKEGADAMPMRMGRYGNFDAEMQSDEDDPDDASAKKEPAEKPHVISLSFKAPEWKVKDIGKVKGSLELIYLGGSEVIKLSNAVPASQVMDMSKAAAGGFNFNSARGEIVNGRLAELGFSLKVQMAMVQGGMTMISLETSGGKSALVDAQVFDADGHPWPTTLIEQDSGGGDDHSSQIMVAGKPKPPFSMAVAVGGVGASLNVPILVENIPVGDK